jgi:hypothetical protein
MYVRYARVCMYQNNVAWMKKVHCIFMQAALANINGIALLFLIAVVDYLQCVIAVSGCGNMLHPVMLFT